MDEVQFGDLHTADPDDPAALAGLPSRDETLSRWSGATGLSAKAIDYYVAFAAYRYAICAIRCVHLMNAAGMPQEAAQYADGMRQGAEAVLERIT